MQFLVLCDKASIYPTVENIEICSIYKDIPKFARVIRFLHHKFHILPKYRKLWLDNWKNEVDKDTNVIIFDTLLDDTPLEILKEKKVRKIVFCFRNRVHDIIKHGSMTRNPHLIREKFDCDIWSYNERDSQEYNLKLYHQFHIIPDGELCYQVSPEYDLFFIGSDKGRMPIISYLADIAQNQGLSYLFKVIPTASNYSSLEKEYLSSPISYREVINCVKKCKCVIDLVSEQNYGLTYRSLEAVAFKKKLVTNYENVIFEKFYSKENIFIIGHDNIEDLSAFINIPFKDVSDSFADYSFSKFCYSLFNL